MGGIDRRGRDGSRKEGETATTVKRGSSSNEVAFGLEVE